MTMHKILFITIVLSSCTAKWYEKGFYRKGGEFKCDPEVVLKKDTLITDSGDTVISEKYVTVYVPRTEYKTKWKTRFDNKRFGDSLDFVRKTYRDSLKYAFKSQKATDKKQVRIFKQKEKTHRSENKWWYWLLLGMPLGVMVYKGLRILLKRI